jgi:uncharacterized membrane protein
MKRAKAKRFWLGVASAGGIAALALGSSTMRPRCTQISGANSISLPLSQLARGDISFFCYNDSAGDRIRFVLARDEDGTVHSALDACRQCSGYHQGYTSAKGQLICRFCGNRYSLKTMEKGRDSCAPVKLPNKQHDGIVEVKVADLKQGKSLF